MITVTRPVELRAAAGVRRVAAAFGVFDGVHIGHRRILDRVLELAHLLDAVPTVITFDTHPRAIVSADRPPRLLTTLPQRLRLLGEAGIEAAVLLPFGPAMAAMAPADFLHTFVFAPQGPDMLALCVGSAWRFGRQGSGDVDTLMAVARPFGCRVESVPEVLVAGRPVSSTRIREEILAGRLEQAAALLGHPFAVAGVVARGKGRGRATLDCPTANIQDPDLVLPPSGVYAARARRMGREPLLPGVAYVGSSPTFAPEGAVPPPRIVEMHLFDLAEMIYGEEIEVEFAAMLREDRRFRSAEDLKAQIARDIGSARQLLGLGPSPQR
jgi:riboflavin kinase/FMN adenylyltransferase